MTSTPVMGDETSA